MSFLAPVLLFGLPLALIPVIIHLIHLLRRRQIPWAAMMFLRKAQKMNRGFSKLRQYLILAFRVLAVLALIFTVARPLAGGLLGLTGGAPDSVLILLDRSASMEEQLLATGSSKRQASLDNLSAAIREAYGKRSQLVLIDSATLTPLELESADALSDVPQSNATDTAADIPGLLQSALDYISANETGRTDVWLVSDLRQSDWDPSSGRWRALQSAYSTLTGIRFHILAYPELPEEDLSVTVENVLRRQSSGGAELLMDIRLQRQTLAQGSPRTSAPTTVPMRVVIDGIGSQLEVTMNGDQTLLRAQSFPLDIETERGWGRVELPTDASPANNAYHFAFDAPATLKSVLITDDPSVSRPLQAVLSSPADASREYESTVLPSSRIAEISWDDTGLIIWHASLPEKDSAEAKQLTTHLASGRHLIFLPPNQVGELNTTTPTEFMGLSWGEWNEASPSAPVDWWRSESGLLGPTRAGDALPVGEVEVVRWRSVLGEGVPLARLGEAQAQATILVRSVGQAGSQGAHFLATLPGSEASSMARDGVVLYAMLHRALSESATTLGMAQHRPAGASALGSDLEATSPWRRARDPNAAPGGALETPEQSLALRAGVLEHPSTPLRLALNRPTSEDLRTTLDQADLEDLFAGLDWRLLERTLEKERSLTSEVWRTFLIIMAAALLLEALLCMPRKQTAEASEEKMATAGF